MAMKRSSRLAPLALLPALLLPSGCKHDEPTDPSIATAVQQRLASDSAISAEPIQASVQGGVVTLSGTVSSDAARSLASNDAGAVAGVRTVLNNLAVQPPISAATALPAPVAAPTPAPEVSRTRDEPRRRERDRRRDRNEAASSAASLAQNNTPSYPAPSSTPQQQAEPTPPPAPVVRSVTLPAGTVIPVRLSQTLSSATAQPGQTFSGSVASDVLSNDGAVVLAQGGNVSGRVTEVQEAAHFKGNALLSIELTNLSRHGNQVPIATEAFSQEGKGRGKNTATKAGIGAAAGAVLGGIFGGGKGAAIGAAAGGGSGVGINAVTRGEQAQIPAETIVRFRLSTPVTVRLSGDESSVQGSGRRPLQ